MRARHHAAAVGLLGPLCGPAHAEARDVSRDTLPANDGWAAYGTCMGGTATGGAAADDDHVDTATDSTESACRAVARGTGAVRMP